MYVTGINWPGCLPDGEVVEFALFGDAVNFAIEEVDRNLESEEDRYGHWERVRKEIRCADEPGSWELPNGMCLFIAEVER